jgi:hypothetical protein
MAEGTAGIDDDACVSSRDTHLAARAGQSPARTSGLQGRLRASRQSAPGWWKDNPPYQCREFFPAGTCVVSLQKITNLLYERLGVFALLDERPACESRCWRHRERQLVCIMPMTRSCSRGQTTVRGSYVGHILRPSSPTWRSLQPFLVSTNWWMGSASKNSWATMKGTSSSVRGTSSSRRNHCRYGMQLLVPTP